MFFHQQEFDIRCEWGEQGVARLAPISDVVIIIDVLSFCTSVEIAVSRGAIVYPYSGLAESAKDFVDSVGAILAKSRRDKGHFSLSPESLINIPNGTRIVLPSPNGSTLTLAAKPSPVLAGCLRNAKAVANAAKKFGQKIAVIPAGERWKEDGSLRPCFEDFVAAGAIIRHLTGSLSPEASMALEAFIGVQPNLELLIKQSGSGKELIQRGFPNDVALASMLDVSLSVPMLLNNAYHLLKD